MEVLLNIVRRSKSTGSLDRREDKVEIALSLSELERLVLSIASR